MAVTCARCGTLNPDGNSFCQACGSPLAVSQVAPAGPPPGTPPPIVGPPPDLPPPSYESPYYTPAAGMAQPRVHRTPWVLIVSAVVGLVLVMGACGTAFALLNNRNGTPTTAVDLPSPTPAGSPTPIPSKSPLPSGPSTASTPAISVTVPAGWTATTGDTDILVTSPAGDGVVWLDSGNFSPPTTAQQIKDKLDQSLAAEYPDTKTCPNTKTSNGSVGGVSGIWWQVCFTVAQGGQSFAGEMTEFAATNSGGVVGYFIQVFTLASRMSTFFNDAKPVLASVQWKLK